MASPPKSAVKIGLIPPRPEASSSLTHFAQLLSKIYLGDFRQNADVKMYCVTTTGIVNHKFVLHGI